MRGQFHPNQVAIWVSLFLATSVGGQGQPATEPAAPDCGAMALYSLLRLAGRHPSFREIESHLPSPSQNGRSMRDLEIAARALGLRLEGMELEQCDEAIDRPMLVFFKWNPHGHYLVIRPVGHTGKLVQVLDPNRPSEIMDKSDLFQQEGWTGLALAPCWSDWPFNLAATFIVIAGMILLTLRVSHWLHSGQEQRPEVSP